MISTSTPFPLQFSLTSNMYTLLLSGLVAFFFFLYTRESKTLPNDPQDVSNRAETDIIRKLPFPPTPKGLPLFGNTFQMPSAYLWRHFSAVSHSLKSPIIHLYVGGNHLVVLNDRRSATEVLEKQGQKSSGRPKMVIWNRMSRGMRFGGLSYGDPHFRTTRRVVTEMLSGVKSGESEALQNVESLSLMLSLSTQPKDFVNHINRFTLSMVFSMSFGLSVPSTTSPIYSAAHQIVLNIVSCLTFGSWFVDFFPGIDEWEWLNKKWDEGWFQNLLPWRKVCEQWYKRHTRVYGALAAGARSGGMEGIKSGEGGAWREIRESGSGSNNEGWAISDKIKEGITDWADGVIQGSQRQLEEQKKPDGRENLKTWANLLSDPEAKGLRGHDESALVLGNLFEAGAETSAISLTLTVMAALLHPQETQKAQEEIDSIVGPDRLPNFSDREKLPYANAFIQEVARWRPVAPLGIPRAATEDIEFDGYRIPKGSTLFANIWEINRDQSFWGEDIESFKPERHLVSDPTGGRPIFVDYSVPIFGHGRRICPGEQFARRSIFIATAQMLWAFHFRHVIDEKSKKPIEVDSLAFDSSVNPVPLPFPVNIGFRDASRATILQREWEAAPKDMSSLLPSL